MPTIKMINTAVINENEEQLNLSFFQKQPV